MNQLKAGFGRAVITPKLGIPIRGYFKRRLCEGAIDPLEVTVLALSAQKEKSLLISVDNCGIGKPLVNEYREKISNETDIPVKNIIIGSTHTHTGPETRKGSDNPLVDEYVSFLYEKMMEAVRTALADLTEAKMGYGVGEGKNISFPRRYLMKDGSIKTNPGVKNPDVLRPIGAADERVSVLRFDRTDGRQLIFVQFATHPDVVGGSKVSADWPGLLRRVVEKTIDNASCIFFNGTQGDVNHVNVHPVGGDFNGLENDFDDVPRGYAHARHMANVVAGGVLQCFEKVKFVDVDKIITEEKIVKVPSNMPKPEDMEEAYRINALHKEGRDEEIPYSGMMLTTVVAEAARMIRLEHGPEYFEMPMTGLRLGPVAFVTIPGEGFTGIGMALKKCDKYALTIPLGLSNGYEGYFPMQDSYDEGGYEARSSNFKAGSAEHLIEEGMAILKSM